MDNIASGLSTADPEHADLYAKNAEAYKARLAELDAEFASIVKKGRHRTLVFGGRFAYLYFLKHYGLNYVTAYDTATSISPMPKSSTLLSIKPKAHRIWACII